MRVDRDGSSERGEFGTVERYDATAPAVPPVSAEAPKKREALLRPEDMERRILELGKEPSACLVCGAPNQQKSFFRSDKWFWSCPACELVYVYEIYPEFAEDVGTLDEFYGLREATPAPGRTVKMARSIAAEMEARQGKKGRFLEIGCGQGHFLERIGQAGWDVAGVDILPEAVTIARESRGLDVFAGELFAANFDDQSFDVVFMSEVIEHIVEPIALMREVHRVLRPGGIALLRTGNTRSWSARMRGEHWWYYMFGGHMHIRFYSPKAAEALGRAAGFERTESTSRGFAFREGYEVRGRWYRPLLQLGQGIVSTVAGPCGAGHRLRMYFHRAG